MWYFKIKYLDGSPSSNWCQIWVLNEDGQDSNLPDTIRNFYDREKHEVITISDTEFDLVHTGFVSPRHWRTYRLFPNDVDPNKSL